MSSQTYYNDPALWGKDQYVTLADVVNNFMLMYVGNDKLLDNVPRYNVLFHAKRAVQELNYDGANQPMVMEVLVGDDLRMILPEGYVTYSRISVEHEGVLYKLSESHTMNTAKAYEQNEDGTFIFDINGNLIEEESELDRIRKEGVYEFNRDRGVYGYLCDDGWYFERSFGGAYWIDASLANASPTFMVNKAAGVINFSSGVANKRVVLEYVTDGLSSNASQIYIHKMTEVFLYAYIKWALLNNRINVQEYVVRRAREEKSAALRNVKIRMSGISAGKLLMILRAQDNWIK
jgi:hypothetical protein